jgi:hypothetical protein
MGLLVVRVGVVPAFPAADGAARERDQSAEPLDDVSWTPGEFGAVEPMPPVGADRPEVVPVAFCERNGGVAVGTWGGNGVGAGPFGPTGAGKGGIFCSGSMLGGGLGVTGSAFCGPIGFSGIIGPSGAIWN